ncbi:hypothetical protein EVAR_51889_1 [Eumeta japonica]|uniref:Uncharacterized protein n=1 Tax=Eumeta variegata TaxID=151549 RepID=A0A4C1XHJ7_EUMVA|nr:hypothetical protein EVAR_51889_1 [Eumeta japonica]
MPLLDFQHQVIFTSGFRSEVQLGGRARPGRIASRRTRIIRDGAGSRAPSARRGAINQSNYTILRPLVELRPSTFFPFDRGVLLPRWRGAGRRPLETDVTNAVILAET